MSNLVKEKMSDNWWTGNWWRIEFHKGKKC